MAQDWLGQITPSSDPQIRVNFQKVRDLSGDEASRARDAIGEVYGLLNRHAFVFVEDSYQAYVTALRRHAKMFEESSSRMDVFGAQFDLTTKLATWLLAFRLFLDHTETDLKRTYGKASPHVAAFKSHASEMFDTVPAYRLAYSLRNYTHVALPGSITSMTEAADEGGVSTYLDLELRRDQLLAEFDGWHRMVEDDLRGGPATLQVRPILDAAQKCLREVVIALMGTDLPGALSAVEFLRSLVDEATEACGPGETIIAEPTVGTRVTLSYIPFHFFARVTACQHGTFRLYSLDHAIVLQVGSSEHRVDMADESAD